MGAAIRDETPADAAQVRAVNEAAFETSAEAALVEALHAARGVVCAKVAVAGGRVVGHILFSTATSDTRPELRLAGLAPMAVVPGSQRQGIGSQLVRAGLDACRRAGVEAVIVLGHPAYYPRFGFVPASRFGLTSVYDAGDAFMALELTPGALGDAAGLVRYAPEFDAL